jgi:hypothetical protein
MHHCFVGQRWNHRVASDLSARRRGRVAAVLSSSRPNDELACAQPGPPISASRGALDGLSAHSSAHLSRDTAGLKQLVLYSLRISGIQISYTIDKAGVRMWSAEADRCRLMYQHHSACYGMVQANPEDTMQKSDDKQNLQVISIVVLHPFLCQVLWDPCAMTCRVSAPAISTGS